MSGQFSNPDRMPVDPDIMLMSGVGLAIGSQELVSSMLQPEEWPGAVLIAPLIDRMGGTGQAQIVMPTSVASALAGALAGYRALLPTDVRDQFDAHAAVAAKRYRENTPAGVFDWMRP